MAKNTVLILIMLTIAAIIVVDLVVVLSMQTEKKPQIIAEFTENFTIPGPSSNAHYGYREAAQDQTPSLSDCFTVALINKEVET